MKNIVKNSFNIVFIICFGYILYNSVFENHVNLFTWNKWVVIIGVLANILIWALVYKYVSDKEYINTKVLIPVFLIIIFIIQVVVGNLFRVSPNWDMYELARGAFEYINGEQGYLEYIYRYSNNIAIQIVYIILFKISNIAKIFDYYEIGMMLNIITIDIALILTFLVSKKIFDSKKAFIIFLMVASMTPIYLFVPIIYTDTMSMMFPLLILYLYLLAKEQSETKRKYLLYLLMGIVTCLGASIKFTIVIMPIAIIIYEIINMNKKEIIPIIVMIILASVLSLLIRPLIIKAIFKEWNNKEYNEQQFPITHWIMMGLQGVGQYNQKDVDFTSSFNGKKEKIEKNAEKIKERLNQIIENQEMTFVRRKLTYTWGDGTYSAVNLLDYDSINEGIHQELVFKRGEYHQYYQYYTQMNHITTIVLMVISAIFSIKNKSDYSLLLRISIFGLFLFLLIWETRSRYIINYLPIMQIIAFFGIEELYNFLNESLIQKINIGKKTRS